MVSRIIVPLDQSQLAESALPLAHALAARWEAPVTIVGVPDLPRSFRSTEPHPSSDHSSPGGSTGGSPAEALQSFTGHEHTTPERQPSAKDMDELADAISSYERYLQSVAATFDETRIETLVRPGEPTERILALAGQQEEPVIVMASHGRSGLPRAVVGSVTAEVVQQAHCPVFVVRGTETTAGHAETTLDTILIPLDGSRFAEQALSTVQLLFGGSADQVHLVRLVEKAPDEEAATYLERTAAHQSHMAKQVTWELGEGDVVDEITRVADKVGADVIAMATHGRSGVKRLVLGSVAERVLHETTRPLLLVRPSESDAQHS